MWTHRTGLAPKQKKEDKQTATFPSIPSGPTSLCQRTNLNSRFTKLKEEEAESHIQHHLRRQLHLHHKAETRNYSPSQDKAPDILHLNTSRHLVKGRSEHGRIKKDSPKLLRRLAALGEEEEEEEGKEKEDLDVKEALTSSTEGGTCPLTSPTEGGTCPLTSPTEGGTCPLTSPTEGGACPLTSLTEGGTYPSAGSDEDDADKQRESNKLHRSPPLNTTVAGELQGQEVLPVRLEEKRFMVYICGGYKDTVAERRALMENVYPRLYLYCKQRGYDFRMVDLRLGVGNPVTDRHNTVAIHMENLQRCQETQGANFILFLGQKYEVQILPSTISRDAFEAVVRVAERKRQNGSTKEPASPATDPQPGADGGFFQESVYGNYLDLGERATDSELLSQSSSDSSSEAEESGLAAADQRSRGDLDKDLRLLQMWYKLDENCLPPVYRLLPISTHHPDFLNSDGQRRRRARKDWSATCQCLWGALQRSGAEAIGEDGASLLLRTVLDWEVEQGLRSLGDQAPPEEHCHCYKRVIPDLRYHLKNQHAAQYVDLNPTLSAAHHRFIHRLHKQLRHTNIYERHVGWGRKGLNPKHNRSHQFYTERISFHVQETVISSLNKVMDQTKAKGSYDVMRREAARVTIQEEIQRHVNYGRALGTGCVQRQAFLADVKKVVQDSTGPILLLGAPGWGKSATMAAVAQRAPSWLPGAVKVLVCFIGITGESRNIRLVLQSFCVQLAEADGPHSQPSEGLPQLINDFYSLLGRVGAEKPVVILLDGLDELSEEHGPDLSWISTPLPPNVRLILSATTDSSCAVTLQSVHPTVLSIPPLGLHDITAALEAKLQAYRRRLQVHQWELLLQACLSSPSPLYLEAAYWESRLWTSFSPRAGLSLPTGLEGLYLGLLARLERGHGRQLELLDLLAKDKKVLQEMTSARASSSSHPGVPYVLWARLKHDMGQHLTEVQTDGTWVYRWTHSELSRVCIKHYLKTDDSRMAVHADYADYYQNKSGNAYIFQPLAWTLGEEEGEGMPKSYVFNLRKLRGLPYHLVRSGQILPFLSECVFNYEFLLHKAWGSSVSDVEEDLKKAALPDKVLVDVDVLSSALELSRTVLQQDPCQLASQIMGRLGQIVTEDRPVAPGDPLKFSYLHGLLAQCAQSSLLVLLPSSTCLLPPGGLQHTLLAGHWSNVTALGGGRRGPSCVTCEADGSLRLWDVEMRRVVKTLDGVGGMVADSLTLGLDDRMLVVRMGQSLQVREVESGRVVYSETGTIDVAMVTTACDGQLLVAFYDGSPLVKVFDLASSCSLLRCLNISLESKAIHQDRSIVLSNNSIRDYVLFAYRSGCQAGVFSAREGVVLSVLSAQRGAASVQAVEMTSDYMLLFCRYPYKTDGGIIHIELFSSASFLYLRSILGCSQDYITQVTVNQTGTHAVAFCPSLRTGVTEVVTWNLETEDHKHIARFPAVLTTGLCFDLRFCLGICSGEKHLRLWDLSSRISDQTLTYNVHKLRVDGTEEVVPMGTRPRYAVCRSSRAGTVYVWNLARRRFIGRPVRVEHGLYGGTDVALARHLKLYILTDRSTEYFTRTHPSPRFQTLLVYDLVKRKYVRRLTGLHIVPCPQNDYRLLEDGRTLLGLSETRDHLILWDLETGDIKDGIKPPHTEPVLSGSSVRHQQPDITPTREKTMMPWDIRLESHSARRRRMERETQREKEEQRRLDREKYNAIHQYFLSGDEQVVVCSYFSHHLNVFSLASQEHLHTLEDKTSLLSLHVAALTLTGSHLVLANYSQHTAYVTLWDLQQGATRARLRNEPGVCCLAITDDASRVAFGVTGTNKLKVWDPFKRRHKSISGYGNLRIEVSSKLYMTEGGAKAILLSGQLSLWDLEACSVLSVLSPDAHIQCMTLAGRLGTSVLLGLSHSPTLVTIRPTSQVITATDVSPKEDLFGESSSSEEEEEESTNG